MMSSSEMPLLLVLASLCLLSQQLNATWLYPLWTDRAPFHIRAVYQTHEPHLDSFSITVYYDKREGVSEHWTLGTSDYWSPPVDVRPDHFVFVSCGAMMGDRYECESTLRAQQAFLQDGYTFILYYTGVDGLLVQMEPIRLCEGIPRDSCACSDPTTVNTPSQPTWFQFPKARMTHRRLHDVHLAWSFEGHFDQNYDGIEVIKTRETPRHMPGGTKTISTEFEYLYRENEEVTRPKNMEVSVAKRHTWNGLTPVDVDVIIYGATEDDMGVYSVKFGTEFLSDWGHQWSSVMVHQEDFTSVFPQGRHNPRAGVQVADCGGNLTYNTLPIYRGHPNCLVCHAGGYNVSLTLKKDGVQVPRSDARGNELRSATFLPDSVYLYYYFSDPSPEDAAPFVCTALADDYYVGKAIWVDFNDDT